MRGSELLKQGQLEQALRAFRNAIELDPDNTKVLALLGLAYFRAGQLAEARPIYEQLVELASTDASHRLNLGLVYLKLGDGDRAIHALEASRALDPSQGRAVSYLGLAYARAGRYADAYRSFLLAGQHELAAEIEGNLVPAERDGINRQLGRIPDPSGAPEPPEHTPDQGGPQPAALGPEAEPAAEDSPLAQLRAQQPRATLAQAAPATAHAPVPPAATEFEPDPTPAPEPEPPRALEPEPAPEEPRTIAAPTVPDLSVVPSEPTPAPTRAQSPTPAPAQRRRQTTAPLAPLGPGQLRGHPRAVTQNVVSRAALEDSGARKLELRSRSHGRETAFDDVHTRPTPIPAPDPSAPEITIVRVGTDPPDDDDARDLPPDHETVFSSAPRMTDSQQFVRPKRVTTPGIPTQYPDRSMVSMAVAAAAPAKPGIVRTRAGGTPPRPLSELATDELVRPDDGDDRLEIGPNGNLIVRVTDRMLVRLDGVHVTGGDLSYEPATRRTRGHQTDEPFDHGGSPLHVVSGTGYLIAVPNEHAFAAVALDDDILYLREDLVFAFEATLRWENGNVPGLRGKLPIVQFRGDGVLALRTARPLVRVKLPPQGLVFVDADRLAGWIGRVIPRAVVPPTGGPLGAMCVECTGEGVVLVEPAPPASREGARAERTATATASTATAAAEPPPLAEAPAIAEPPVSVELRELRELDDDEI